MINYARQILPFALLGIVTATYAIADTIPPATVFLSVDEPGGPLTSTTFGVITGGGNILGAVATPTPALNAQSVDGGGNGAALTVESNLTYYFEIVNTNPSATDTSIPVDMTYLEQAIGATPNAAFQYQVATEVQLIENDDNVGLLDDLWTLTVGSSGSGLSQSTCTDESLGNVITYQSSFCTAFTSQPTQLFDLAANTVYRITLADDIYFADNTTVSANVDPFLQIDPAFADSADYSIDFSAGIGNSPLAQTPEPRQTVMLLAGIVGLAVLRKRLSKNLPA